MRENFKTIKRKGGTGGVNSKKEKRGGFVSAEKNRRKRGIAARGIEEPCLWFNRTGFCLRKMRRNLHKMKLNKETGGIKM